MRIIPNQVNNSLAFIYSRLAYIFTKYNIEVPPEVPPVNAEQLNLVGEDTLETRVIALFLKNSDEDEELRDKLLELLHNTKMKPTDKSFVNKIYNFMVMTPIATQVDVEFLYGSVKMTEYGTAGLNLNNFMSEEEITEAIDALDKIGTTRVNLTKMAWVNIGLLGHVKPSVTLLLSSLLKAWTNSSKITTLDLHGAAEWSQLWFLNSSVRKLIYLIIYKSMRLASDVLPDIPLQKVLEPVTSEEPTARGILAGNAELLKLKAELENQNVTPPKPPPKTINALESIQKTTKVPEQAVELNKVRIPRSEYEALLKLKESPPDEESTDSEENNKQLMYMVLWKMYERAGVRIKTRQKLTEEQRIAIWKLSGTLSIQSATVGYVYMLLAEMYKLLNLRKENRRALINEANK